MPRWVFGGCNSGFAIRPMIGLGALLVCASVPSDAAAPAGSDVSNVARARIGDGAEVSSNPVTTRIDEVLDIALAPSATRIVTEDGHSVFAFRLTNKGNGHEAFFLAGKIAQADARLLGFARDADGDGRYEEGVDIFIGNGAATAGLEPDEIVDLFAVFDGMASADGTLRVDARAVTGSGAQGTNFAGKGDGGGAAIVGATTAAAELSIDLGGGGGGNGPKVSLVKAQSVAAPDGSPTPMQGAIVTYTLSAGFEGSGTAPNARLRDAIPAGTDYVPGSIRLGDASLTDTADGDAASFDGEAITVALGDVPAPASRTILFKVKIK